MKIKRGVNFKLKNPKNDNVPTGSEGVKIDVLDSNRNFNSQIAIP